MKEEYGIDALSSTPASSDAQGESLQLRALLRPVGTRVDRGAMDVAERLLLECILPQVESRLAELTSVAASVTPRLELEDSSFTPMRDEVFAVRIALTAAQGPPSTTYLTIDQTTARAIVDSIEARLAGVRGVGELTDAELGLLEFVSLELIECIAREAPSLAGRMTVDAFLAGKEIMRDLADSGLEARAAFCVGVGPHAGTAMLWSQVRSGAPSIRLRAPGAATGESTSASLWVALALPPIELDTDRAASLRAGDVVLLGTGDLMSFGTGYRLLGTSGWELGRASLVEDSPTQATASAGELQPCVARFEVSRPGKAVLVATLGWLELTAEQLKAWRAGDTLAFAKSGSGTVGLHGPTSSVSGELVRVGEEVGVRVLA
ncbi:MAG: hypothetical protein ACI841_000714 [Planctomycetota bacterium]|jgi:hypothetical protein